MGAEPVDEVQVIEGKDNPSSVHKSTLWILCAPVILSLLLAAWFLLEDSLTTFRTWSERPHVTVDAELVGLDSRQSTKSESGYYYRGEYLCMHKGFKWRFTDKHEYEQSGLVPKTKSVSLYLGTDDQWHLLGSDGSGIVGIIAYGLGGVACIVGGVILAVLMLRHIDQ